MTPHDKATAEQAVYEIKRFSRNDNLPRPEAEALLNKWGGYHQVTAAAREHILAAFPEPKPRDTFDIDYFLESLGEYPALPHACRLVP